MRCVVATIISMSFVNKRFKFCLFFIETMLHYDIKKNVIRILILKETNNIIKSLEYKVNNNKDHAFKDLTYF